MTLPARLNARLGLAACLLGLTIAVPVIELAIAPAPAEARAGGSYGSSRSSASSSRSSYSGSRSSSWSSSRSRSGSGGSGGGLSGFMAFLFLVVGGFAMLALLSKAKKHATFTPPVGNAREQIKLEALLAEAAQRDGVWREDALVQHARDAFEAVQRAWVARNQDLAFDYMTPRLYQNHKQQTDGMIARGERAVLGQLTITGARIVHVADRLNDDQDMVWIQFTARAEDYLMSEQTGKVLKGAKGQVSVFKEIWKFKRDGRTWKVDQIDGNADQALPASFSETQVA
jgi:predicted lipid-binding transport protein (Tim44 family)